MAAERPVVPVITGATATGKTALVAALAELEPLSVISADSRQIYRGLDIGTAKPPAALLAHVPHWGVDIVDVGQAYSAGRFARDAAGWLITARERGQVVVAGGTGFYIRALTQPLFEEPPLDPGARARVRNWSASLADPVPVAQRLDPGFRATDRQRAARAIEVALLTGRPVSYWHRQPLREPIIAPVYFIMELDRDAIETRIRERVIRMVDGGLVEEAQRAISQGHAASAAGLDAVGYREAIDFLEGRIDRHRMVEAIVLATRQYARRQATWLRHQLRDGPVTVLDAGRGSADLARDVLVQMKRARAG